MEYFGTREDHRDGDERPKCRSERRVLGYGNDSWYDEYVPINIAVDYAPNNYTDDSDNYNPDKHHTIDHEFIFGLVERCGPNADARSAFDYAGILQFRQPESRKECFAIV